ncbi:MAG TPA: hypothetical protein VL651_15800 [Bacteroidia bacterium]|jgi:hypothetical protein|nr:hypothetical protein [Bacteroidia bacterium]
MSSDQITHWLKVLEVALISSVKFLFAPFEAERYDFNFGQSFAVTTIGGIVGIMVFYYAGTNIAMWWRHVKAIIKSIFLRKPAAVIERKPSRNFTRNRRFVVRVKMKFGLTGIAVITPCIISIPIGTIIAAQFFRRRKPVLLYLTTSLVLWSLILNGLAQLLKLSQYIPHVK